jgi:hypothetical protein
MTIENSATGSIYGGGVVAITSKGSRPLTVSIGGIVLSNLGISPSDPTVFFVYAPRHAAGPVDVVVPHAGDGGSQVIAGGYTYLDPESFDLNGAWTGVTVDGSDTWVEFTVQGNLLLEVHCLNPADKREDLRISAPIINGKVDTAGDWGRFSAWVASESEAAGTIDMAQCAAGGPWIAQRRHQDSLR